MKNFNIVIRVESSSGSVHRNSFSVKAVSILSAYNLGLDIISSYFSEDFDYTIIGINEL